MTVIEVRPHRNGWIVERAIPFTVVATALCAVQRASHRDAATGSMRWIINPPGARVVVCSIACLPDERHITGQRCSGTAIVDTDRVCAGHLDVHRVVIVDVHDVGSRCATISTGDGLGQKAARFQADPVHDVAGDM